MILKILFISDRVSDYHTFVRSHSSLTAGLDLLNHVEANRRYQFPTFYDIFIIDLHDPWIAIPPWLREQAQQHYFHQFIFISDKPLNNHLKDLLGPRVYKVLDSKTAQNDLKDVVAELTESMSEHRYQTGSVSHNFDGLPYGLVGKHPSIIRINEFIQLVSKARYAPCLIRGESGSGKDLCAKLIHQANNIHDDLFFVKDCENSTTYKLLGDLFGVEDDSGVYGPKRKGLLEIYNGGTVVLNNIEKLPPGVQDKLLFYLEERAFKPMGGTRPVVSNVRVIGISQHNLEWFVKHQNFNPDLFYHLNAFEIDLPPLRDRGDDIITLAHFYRQYYNFLFGKSTLSFTPQVEQLLLEYHWPGNVKELKDAIERAVFIANSSQITSKELPGYFKSSTGNDAPGEDFLGNCSMREMERIHIEHVLSFTKGNKSKAASILEISRTTLREKIRQYGISE